MAPQRQTGCSRAGGYVAPSRPDGSQVLTHSLFHALFICFVSHGFLFPSSSSASLRWLVSLLLGPPAMPPTLGLQIGWVSSLMRLGLFVDTVAEECLTAFDEDAWFNAFHLFQIARLPCLYTLKVLVFLCFLLSLGVGFFHDMYGYRKDDQNQGFSVESVFLSLHSF